MSDTYNTIEARILNAIKTIRDEIYLNYTKIATAFKLSVRTFQRR